MDLSMNHPHDSQSLKHSDFMRKMDFLETIKKKIKFHGFIEGTENS